MDGRNSPETPAESLPRPRERLGRYALYGALGSGGAATVYLGRLLGHSGFKRTVAIKRLHASLAKDPEFVTAFLDEARLAASIHHPNVVSTLDVVSTAAETFLVLEYVDGQSLSRLLREAVARAEHVPLRIAAAIVSGMLRGLHAAHEARSESGQKLHLIHRDVSPQNVLVGRDGVPRLADFGIAKAVGRAHTTDDGRIKGKLGYMSPEQITGRELTRRTDIYSAGIVLWELLARERLFTGETQAALVEKVMFGEVPSLAERRADVPVALQAVVDRALARVPEERFGTAREMADALDAAVAPATAAETSDWVEQMLGPVLSERAELVARVEAEPEVEAVASSHAMTRTTAAEPAAKRRAARAMLATVGVVVAIGALAVGLLRHAAGPSTHSASAAPAPSLGSTGEVPLATAASVAPPSASTLPSESMPLAAPASASAQRPAMVTRAPRPKGQTAPQPSASSPRRSALDDRE